MQDLATFEATRAHEVRRLEVLTGPERRRSYTAAQKARMVAETVQPGMSAADVARQHGVHPQLLYIWRRWARRGALLLAAEDVPLFAVLVAGPASADTPAAPSCSGADIEMVVELGDVRVRIGSGVPAERAAAPIAALQAGG